MEDVTTFLSELPHQLKHEVSLFIYSDRYQKITFIRFQTKAFVAWICPLLEPLVIEKEQYVYQEGDQINHFFFLMKGDVCYVLPRLLNKKYLRVDLGDKFGLIDIVEQQENFLDCDLDELFAKSSKMHRCTTLQAQEETLLMKMDVKTLIKMKNMFPKEFEILCDGLQSSFRKVMVVKQQAI